MHFDNSGQRNSSVKLLAVLSPKTTIQIGPQLLVRTLIIDNFFSNETRGVNFFDFPTRNKFLNLVFLQDLS
jgi:hypothetical protein